MSTSRDQFPPHPAFKRGVRLARWEDVPRLGIVATAGFYYSNADPHVRPRRTEFPTDTFLSYQAQFAKLITAPDFVTIVALDAYNPQENDKIKDIIRPDRPLATPARGEPMIVGVATWKLPPGSPRHGQFVPAEGTMEPDYRLDAGLGRDASARHAKLLFGACNDAAEERFPHDLTVDKFVVHPAYWSRGHGSRLLARGNALADMDGMNQGVVATEMGARVYPKAGFEKLGELLVRDEEATPESVVKFQIFQYDHRPGG